MVLPLRTSVSYFLRGGSALAIFSARMPQTSAAQSQRWHPKLTPYRFLVVATTIGLGAAKASVSDEGQTWVATTLEWVTAVVIFCMLSVMRILQMVSNGVPPQFLYSRII